MITKIDTFGNLLKLYFKMVNYVIVYDFFLFEFLYKFISWDNLGHLYNIMLMVEICYKH